MGGRACSTEQWGMEGRRREGGSLPPSPSRPQDGALGGPGHSAAPTLGSPLEGRRALLLCSVLSRALYPTHSQINSDHASLFDTPSDSDDGQSWGAGALGGQRQVGARAGVGLPAGGDPVGHPPEDGAAPSLEQGGPRFPAPVSSGPCHSKHTCSLSSIPLGLAGHAHGPSLPFTPYSPSIHPPATPTALHSH